MNTLKTVSKLDLQTGDIVHVQLGGSLGDGLPPWIPTQEEINAAYAEWRSILPQDTPLIITHHMNNPSITRNHTNVTTWPPKVIDGRA